MVHVITRLDVGGAQETAVRICAGLDRNRFRPRIITGADRGSGGTLLPAAEAAGIDVEVLPTLRGPIRPVEDARALRSLSHRLRQLAPDIVHTHSSKAGALGRIAARRAGVPGIVHTVHGWSFNDSQHRMVASGYRWIERVLAPRTDVLVVVTGADREAGLAARIGRPDQYELVRSGIPLGAAASTVDRDEVRAKLGWSPEDIVVITVGRLEDQKDPLTLVGAAAVARRSVPELRVAFVGGGSLEHQVRSAVDERGLGGRVDLLGLRSDVPSLLVAADLFALSSRWEGLPRAVLEAMAAGLPVAATDTGGVREVIADGVTGRLVPIGSADLLGAALAELALDRPASAAMARAAADQLEEYSQERMVERTQEVYDAVLEPTGAM